MAVFQQLLQSCLSCRHHRCDIRLPHETGEFIGRKRTGKIESLIFIAVIGSQERELLQSFDSFGDNGHIQIMGHGDDSCRNSGIAGIMGNAINKGTVDLQDVYGKPFEVAEGRIAGTEVIDGKGNAHCFQIIQFLD